MALNERSISPEQRELLTHREFNPGQQVMLFLDGDEPGQQAMRSIAQNLCRNREDPTGDRASIRVIDNLKDKSDPDEYSKAELENLFRFLNL